MKQNDYILNFKWGLDYLNDYDVNHEIQDVSKVVSLNVKAPQKLIDDSEEN